MEYPGIAEYGGFHDLNGPNMQGQLGSHNHGGNFGEGVGGGGRQTDFKREFDASLGIGGGMGGGGNAIRRPPLRQGSGSSFGMQIPRSVPEQYHHLQHQANGGEGIDLMGPVNDLPFR